jgi:hypothetical protein
MKKSRIVKLSKMTLEEHCKKFGKTLEDVRKNFEVVSEDETSFNLVIHEM